MSNHQDQQQTNESIQPQSVEQLELNSPPLLKKNFPQIQQPLTSCTNKEIESQRQQRSKLLSSSQSPANLRPRFSQYGLQNFSSKQQQRVKREQVFPRIESSKNNSMSPQIIPANKIFKNKNMAKSSNQQKNTIKKILESDKKSSVFNISDGYYKYYIGSGNNEQLIKKVMKRRFWWKETFDSTTMLVNFKWQQSNRGYRYDRLIVSQNYKQLVNHFEHHREITNKQYLLKNLTHYCENFKINVFDYVPLTFIVDFSDDNCDYNVNIFLKAYEQYMPESMKKNINEGIPKFMLEIKRKLRGHFTQGNYNYRDYGNATKYKIIDTFIDGLDSKFLWLLKPTFLNRGRGIHVFENLRNLVQLISEYQEGYIEKTPKKEEIEDDPKQNDLKSLASPEIKKQKSAQKQQSSQNKQMIQPQQQIDPNTYIRTIPTGPVVIKAQSFVVQKYLEKPALINNRKFDVRVWALLTHDLNLYFFSYISEGYIRTSCEEFDNKDVDNQFIHLTNNAIQKYSSNYGQFEQGNQLSFDQYQEYLDQHNFRFNVKQVIFYQKILTNILGFSRQYERYDTYDIQFHQKQNQFRRKKILFRNIWIRFYIRCQSLSLAD